jgi:hypothetical protein
LTSRVTLREEREFSVLFFSVSSNWDLVIINYYYHILMN